MFPCFPARASMLRAQNLCPRHKNVSDFFQKHFLSATNVSRFAQHGNNHEQHCVLVCHRLYWFKKPCTMCFNQSERACYCFSTNQEQDLPWLPIWLTRVFPRLIRGYQCSRAFCCESAWFIAYVVITLVCTLLNKVIFIQWKWYWVGNECEINTELNPQ